MKTYTWTELLKMQLDKRDLAAKVGITCSFDTALPQAWLDDFVNMTGLDYDQVRYSTFATYPDDSCWEIMVSAWDLAQEELNKVTI